MKLKTFLFLPIVTGVVIYAGLKGYIYFGVKGKLEDLQKMAAPFATLTYGEIDSDLRGSVTVANFAARPVGTTLDFRVKEIEIEGPGLSFLLALSGDFRNSEPPDSMRWHFRRASIPADEDLMSQLGSLSPMSAGKAEEARPLEACSLGGVFQHIGMEKIGYRDLPIDFSMGYEYYRLASELTVSADYHRPGLESFEWKMVFKNMPDVKQVMAGSMPELSKLEGAYQVDKIYIKRMVDYCAKQANVTPQQFVDNLFHQSDAYYARNIGIIPGPGILMVLKSLLTGATEVGFSAYPSSEITSEMLAAYQPDELISALGLQMSVSGKRVLDMSFRVPENPQAYADNNSDNSSSGPTEAELRAQQKPRRFIKTKLADLKNHLGASIRLYIKNENKVRAGILDAIGNGVIDVKQRASGGTFIAHIPIETIESVEVWRTVE